ncbi:MAG: preprotein translocase subunit SecE [Gemmatimonadetes bacterium]|nr:preprotein translocase subunit SecE [Gemmatimonadota bacterium]
MQIAQAAQGDEVTVSKVLALAGKSVRYIRDVRGEMRKVTLPTMAELRQQTVAIVIVVTIVGVIIGLMDWFFSFTLIRTLGRLIG